MELLNNIEPTSYIVVYRTAIPSYAYFINHKHTIVSEHIHQVSELFGDSFPRIHMMILNKVSDIEIS